MKEKIKARVMDAVKMRRAMTRICTEIIETNKNLKNLVMVGLKTRGVFLGKRISGMIEDMEGLKIPVGTLDITPYRDDIPADESRGAACQSDLDFPVDKKDVIIVDDVLMTGRTIRAAMDAVISLGRPKSIQLLVLVDRGHRELPIRPDYAGKILPTSRREKVRVSLKECDGEDEVAIAEPIKIKKLK